MNELEFRMCKECKVVKPLDINHFYVNRVYKGKSIIAGCVVIVIML